ncbi:MAG: DUF5050 domain-containing protein [Clostridia bacterium]|nr:DUF5050 domain-containing protein [Clostridia bacterium]MDY6184003.1 DUF5050 domain-containing protein [Eubacteriales bacterium]
MKKLSALLLLILCLSICVLLSACGDTTTPTPPDSSDGGTDTPGSGDGNGGSPDQGDEDDPTLQTITGVTLESATVPYDGSSHALTVTGNLPAGVSCTYTYNDQNVAGVTADGTYTVKAVLSGTGYVTKTLTATLTITPLEITGVTLEGATVPYNGSSHSLTVTGTLPAGVSCTYTYNDQSVAGVTADGTYTVKAVLSGTGYVTKTLTATLTITPLEITGVTLDDLSVEYDGLPHSLTVVGNVPSEVRVTYTYNGTVQESATDSGTYTVTATLSGTGYVTKTLTATLKITSDLEQLYCYSFGGKVYFQNPLHDNLLYVWDGSALSKVTGNENAQFFTEANGTLYFTSKGLYKSSVKQLSSDGSLQTFITESGEYLATDGTYLYYAVNNLVNTGNKNGIWRIAFDHEEDEAPVQITTEKASYLTVIGNYLYYAAGGSKGVLKRISLSTSTPTPETLTDKDVSGLVASNGVLYLNVHTLTGTAIHKYSPSTGTLVKMTTDHGDNLTVLGDYLYYINSDLLTGTIFGDGVYRIALSAEGSLPGTKVVNAEVSSLTSDGTNLYYYLVSNKHLHRYNPSTKTVTDLMASFTPVDDTTPVGYAQAVEYNGEIWFINARDGGALYKYNPASRATYKVIPDACCGFWFHDGYLYYSTYIVTNYDLYRIPLAGGEAERISKSRCDCLLFVDDYIYFVDNGVTYNTLRRLKPDSTAADKEEETLYGSTNKSVHFLALFYRDGKIWFCTNPAIGYKKLMSYDIATGSTTEITNGETFVADDTALYFYNQKDKTLCAYTFATEKVATLATNVNIQSLALSDGKVYYINTASGNTGLWSVSTAGTGNTKLVSGNFSGVSVCSRGILYYDMSYTVTNDYPVANTGTGHLRLWDGSTSSTLV